MIITVGFDNTNMLARVRELITRGAEALMMVGRIEDPGLETLIREKGLPVITTYTVNNTPITPSIGIDNYKAVKQMVEYLLRLGHRRLAMIAGLVQGNDRQQARVQAFIDTRRERGIRDPWPIIEHPYDEALEKGASAMRQLHAEHPEATGVVCTNDAFAFAALSECRKLALAVPGQISITGFDDQDFAAILDPPLTTVSIPAFEMGQAAARQLIDALENEVPLRSVCLKSELVIRGSAGKPRKS